MISFLLKDYETFLSILNWKFITDGEDYYGLETTTNLIGMDIPKIQWEIMKLQVEHITTFYILMTLIIQNL